MIVSAYGLPVATRLEWTLLFEKLGAPFLFVNDEGNAEVVKPAVRRAFLNTRVVLASNAKAFLAIQDRLAGGTARYSVFVAGNPVLIEDTMLPLWPNSTISLFDILALENEKSTAPIFSVLAEARETLKDKYCKGTSVIQRCHTLFYREADKSKRLQLQAQVWSYLCGKTKVRPLTGVRALDLLLESERAQTLRMLSKQVQEKGLQEVLETTGEDEFELQYLQHKLDELSR